MRFSIANEVTNPYSASKVAELLYGNPIGKRGAQKTSNARADDPNYRNVFLLQDFNDSQMRKSPGESATQGEHNAGRATRTQVCALAQSVA